MTYCRSLRIANQYHPRISHGLVLGGTRSHELGWLGEVKPVKAFDREMVLYRTRSGRAVLQDAFCPHLGAHLGHEGRVIGETVFAARSTAGSSMPTTGMCESHSLLRRHSRAGPDSHLAHRGEERRGVRLVPPGEHRATQWDLPDLPELGDPNWTAPSAIQSTWCRPTCRTSARTPATRCTFSMYTARTSQCPNPTVTIDPDDGRTMHLHSDMVNADFPNHLHATTYSPGFAMVRNTYGPNAEMIMYNSAQPVDRNTTFMRWTLIVRREIEDQAGDDVMKGIIDGLSDDYPIWANKVHKRRPVFCKGDSTLVTFRKWVRQFYLTSQDKREIA